MKFTTITALLLASTTNAIQMKNKAKNTKEFSALPHSDWNQSSETNKCDYDWFPWTKVVMDVNYYEMTEVAHYADCVSQCNEIQKCKTVLTL